VRVAIVGTGVIAAAYADSIALEPRLELVGATDALPGRAERFTAAHGGTAYPSLAALLADERVELVVNLTPARAHAEVTRACLEAGRHVHTEKPLALDAAAARELAGLASDRGLRLSCAPATLLGEAQQTAWKLVRDGELGDVRVVYAEANWGRIESWHPEPEGLYEAGPLRDVGIYPLTIATAIFGPVRSVTGYAATLQSERVRKDGRPFVLETPDFWTAALEHEGGVRTRLTASFWVAPSKQRGLEFHGDRGSLWMPTWSDYDSLLSRTRDGEHYEEVPLLRPPQQELRWSRALLDVADAISEGRPHRMSAEHAAHVVEVLDAVDESRRRGGPMPVRSSFEPPAPLEWAI
jgi:predicted dehydrogenase